MLAKRLEQPARRAPPFDGGVSDHSRISIGRSVNRIVVAVGNALLTGVPAWNYNRSDYPTAALSLLHRFAWQFSSSSKFIDEALQSNARLRALAEVEHASEVDRRAPAPRSRAMPPTPAWRCRTSFGHVPEAAVRMVAAASERLACRGPWHGHLLHRSSFRRAACLGCHAPKLCRAASAPGGGRRCARPARAQAELDIGLGETTPDRRVTLEATYCLCACAPSAMLDGACRRHGARRGQASARFSLAEARAMSVDGLRHPSATQAALAVGAEKSHRRSLAAIASAARDRGPQIEIDPQRLALASTGWSRWSRHNCRRAASPTGR